MEKKTQRGFTLIELLVVVAIIGILASVVLASLNSARGKGNVAAIKSNLRNMIAQVEMSYDTPGNYSAACASVAGMLSSIGTEGATGTCYSYTDGATDINTRWGVSAKMNQATFQAYSVDSNGVITWDNADQSGTITWDAANTACAAAGGHLHTPEHLKALSDAYFTANATHTPTGFVASGYWSSISVPSNNTNAYFVDMSNGGVSTIGPKTSTNHVRCVK